MGMEALIMADPQTLLWQHLKDMPQGLEFVRVGGPFALAAEMAAAAVEHDGVEVGGELRAVQVFGARAPQAQKRFLHRIFGQLIRVQLATCHAKQIVAVFGKPGVQARWVVAGRAHGKILCATGGSRLQPV